MIRRIIVNVMLLILSILEFSRAYLTPEIHEIIGVSLLVLMAIHLFQNRKYAQTMTKGSTRKVLLITNILLLLTFTATIVTGLLSSRMIGILNIHDITTIYLHKMLSYTALLLISVHLGLNMKRIICKYEDKIRNRKIYYILTAVIILLGAYSFIVLDYMNHLTGNVGFSANDTNIRINSMEYLLVVLAIALITYHINKKCSK